MIIIEINGEEHLQMALRSLRREWRLTAGEPNSLPHVIIRMVAIASVPQDAGQPPLVKSSQFALAETTWGRQSDLEA